MRAALGASPESISWVLTSFIITAAIATPATGWLSDRLGSRNLFLLSTVVFLASSAACGAATTLEQMVLFRGIQGISAAFIGPLTQTIMFDVSPPSKQAMTMSVFSMIVMVAPITGPFVGGFLTQYLNWRWIYYVNLPIGIPALVILWWLLPSRPIERRRLDLFGFAFIGLGLASLQLMLDRGQHKDWFDSKEIVIELVVALCAFWIFVVHTRKASHPLFNRELYKNTNFLISLTFMIAMGITVIGLSSVLPMLFQSIYGYSVMDTGLLMAPRGIGVTITTLLGGMAIRYVDFRYIIAVGYLIAAAAMWLMSGWALEMDFHQIILASFVQGVGLGMVFAPMNLVAFSTLPPELRPDGGGLLQLFRNIGGSLGISVIVTLLARNQQVSHADLAAHVNVPAVGMIAERMQGFGSGVLGMVDAEINRQAMMIAFLDDFHLLTWVMLAFIPLPFLLRRPKDLPALKPATLE
jgi:DHA2 family multidrug resistance protein